ncbi:unnamed protein product [Rotaria sp. Silwood1]|nr:unnamed protein product [Rotaria sp. Silwood1]
MPNGMHDSYAAGLYQNIKMNGYAIYYTRNSLASWWDDGCIGMARTNSLEYFNEFYVPQGHMTMHPARNGNRACVRYTMQNTDEIYDIDASFISQGPSLFLNGPLSNGYATVDVHLSINNVTLASMTINRSSGGFFRRGLRLNYGDIIQFEVGYGENKNYFSDTITVDIKMTRYVERE